jgi:hypothetical protein
MLDTLQSAMVSMKAALADLDDADAPADIGAHLDLAIYRLEAALGQSGSEPRATASK